MADATEQQSPWRAWKARHRTLSGVVLGLAFFGAWLFQEKVPWIGNGNGITLGKLLAIPFALAFSMWLFLHEPTD
jgi:hypothetical protein